jgi:hypothetical protein
MLDKILLNWQPYKITENDLPVLITYAKHMGGSHLSIVLIADLFLRGSKIIFLTAYPMAKDNFLNQVGINNPNIIFVDSVEGLEEAANTQAIIIESGNATLFLNAIKNLPDLNERIIFIKNIEIFSEEVYDACIKSKKLIISGDIDECDFKDKIPNQQFKTIIAFNQTTTKINIEIPKLEKWDSFLSSENQNGILTLENKDHKFTL